MSFADDYRVTERAEGPRSPARQSRLATVPQFAARWVSESLGLSTCPTGYDRREGDARAQGRHPGGEWVSAGSSDFNRDQGFTHSEEELRPFLEGQIPLTVTQMAEACNTDVTGYVSEGPGLSAYALSAGTVYRTYVTTARGLEVAMGYYGLLDRTPLGRHEKGEQTSWLRRHDEYGKT
jgi:hypothetical protein